MPTIVATPGDATANSYVTEVEFIAYLASRGNLYSGATVSGSTCTDAEKTALIEATRDLTDLPWTGTRVDLVQRLAWPREYARNPDAPEFLERGEISELYYDETVVPDRVKDATCELAVQYLKAGTTDLAVADPERGLVSKTLGPISKTWAQGQKPSGLARFPRILGRVAPLLAASGTRMVRK